MGLYAEPLVAILDAIKTLNDVELVADEYIYGPPTPVTEDAKATNTSMLISAGGSTTPYDGSVTIRYRRLPLSELLQLVPSTIKANGITSTTDLAVRLNEAYGTNFTGADIVNTAVTLVDGEGPVTLEAKPDSLGWIGSVTFEVRKGNYMLPDFVLVKTLPGLYYPDADPGKPFASMYSYYRDCTGIKERFDGVSSSTPDWQTAIKDALVVLTSDTWVTVGAARYSLEDAVLTYNGPTEGRTDVNTDYSNAMIVALSPTKCLGLGGNLVLHYNLADEFG